MVAWITGTHLVVYLPVRAIIAQEFVDVWDSVGGLGYGQTG